MTTTVVYAACECAQRLDAHQRVRLALITLADRLGSTLDVTQADLAVAAQTARETANRELSRLARAGLVERKRGRIIVRDLDALRAL